MKYLFYLIMSIAFQSAVNADTKAQAKEHPLKWFREASYCIAYELNSSEAPLKKGLDKSFSHARILITRTHLNILGLTTRSIRHKLLSKEQMKGLTKATFESKVYYPPRDCYSPHHVFVFFDDMGVPLTCIEVCFSCNTIKFSRDLNDTTPPPNSENRQASDDPFHSDTSLHDFHAPLKASGDLGAIAKICIQAGLRLGEFKNLDAFQKANQPIKR